MFPFHVAGSFASGSLWWERRLRLSPHSVWWPLFLAPCRRWSRHWLLQGVGSSLQKRWLKLTPSFGCPSPSSIYLHCWWQVIDNASRNPSTLVVYLQACANKESSSLHRVFLDGVMGGIVSPWKKLKICWSPNLHYHRMCPYLKMGPLQM